MIAVIQRVTHATVTSDSHKESIKKGYMVLLGIGQDDGQKEAEVLAKKIVSIRLMADKNGKMNLSLQESGGELLVVSQFTLLGNSKKGNRPSFIKAADPTKAKKLYNYFVSLCAQSDIHVGTGSFGNYMQIQMEADGPTTIILNTDDF